MLDSEIKRGAVSADLLWQARGALANLCLSRAGGLPHREIMALDRLGMAEAKHILKPGGTLSLS